jgi:hypothetical protein
MTFAVLHADDLTGIIVSVFVGAYLIYILVRPERL